MPIRTCARCGIMTDNPNASSCPGLGAAQEVSPSLSPPLQPPPGSRQYKVVTQRDGYFASKFNPEALQNLLRRDR